MERNPCLTREKVSSTIKSEGVLRNLLKKGSCTFLLDY